MGQKAHEPYTTISNWADWARISGALSGKTYELTGEAIFDVFLQSLFLDNAAIWLKFQRLMKSPESFNENLEWLLRNFEFLDRMRIPFLRIIAGYVCQLLDFPALQFQAKIERKTGKNNKALLLSIAKEMCRGRRMIKTKQGWIGLATGEIKEGDILVLLEGGNVPYILRRTGAEHVYTVVGDAFIHGSMSGEKWELERCHTIWLV